MGRRCNDTSPDSCVTPLAAKACPLQTTETVRSTQHHHPESMAKRCNDLLSDSGLVKNGHTNIEPITDRPNRQLRDAAT